MTYLILQEKSKEDTQGKEDTQTDKIIDDMRIGPSENETGINKKLNTSASIFDMIFLTKLIILKF